MNCFNALRGILRCSGITCFLKVYVIPKSSETHLKIGDGELIFLSSAPCKKHGVNADLLKLFRKNIGCEAEIVRGWRTRLKSLALRCGGLEEAARKICSYIDE